MSNMANISYLRAIYSRAADVPTLSFSDIMARRKVDQPVKNPSDECVSLSTLQRKIIYSVSYCREITKDVDIEAEIMDHNCIDHTDNVYAELHKLPRLPNDTSCSIKMIMVRPEFNRDVEFNPDYLQDDGTSCPMFKLVVPPCKPNTMQNINTGYIIEIPSRIDIFNPMNEQTSKGAFVIIPHIVSTNKSIVPSIHARDADDTGPYTVSVYNRCGSYESCEIQVFLHAYRVQLNMKSLSYENYNEKHPHIIKKKDVGVETRNIYNFSSSVKFSKGVVKDKSIKFPCYDDDKSCRQKTNVVINDQFVFFESRKREWCNTKLFTLSGVFSPNAPPIEQKKLMPLVMCNGTTTDFNTHCFVLLDSRLTLKNYYGELRPTHLAVNGTMRDVGNYKDMRKALRKLLNDVKFMRSITFNDQFEVIGCDQNFVENRCKRLFINFKTVAQSFFSDAELLAGMDVN